MPPFEEPHLLLVVEHCVVAYRLTRELDLHGDRVANAEAATLFVPVDACLPASKEGPLTFIETSAPGAQRSNAAVIYLAV